MAVKKGTGKNGNAKRPAGGMQAPYITKGAKSKSKAKAKTVGNRAWGNFGDKLRKGLATPSLAKVGNRRKVSSPMSKALRSLLKEVYGLTTLPTRAQLESQTSTRPAGGMQAPYTTKGAKSKSKSKAKK